MLQVKSLDLTAAVPDAATALAAAAAAAAEAEAEAAIKQH